MSIPICLLMNLKSHTKLLAHVKKGLNGDDTAEGFNIPPSLYSTLSDFFSDLYEYVHQAANGELIDELIDDYQIFATPSDQMQYKSLSLTFIDELQEQLDRLVVSEIPLAKIVFESTYLKIWLGEYNVVCKGLAENGSDRIVPDVCPGHSGELVPGLRGYGYGYL